MVELSLLLIIDMTNKIVIIGPHKSGKSSLLERVTNNNYTDTYTATIGVSFGIKSFVYDYGHSLQLQLWDISGLNTYRYILPAYIKDSDVVLLVINTCHTIDDIYYHLEMINRYTPESKIYMVVSKMDLNGDRTLDSPLDELIKDNKYNLHYISSKTTEGIDGLFSNIEDYLTNLESKPVALSINDDNNEDGNEYNEISLSESMGFESNGFNLDDRGEPNYSKYNKKSNKCSKCKIM